MVFVEDIGATLQKVANTQFHQWLSWAVGYKKTYEKVCMQNSLRTTS